MSQPVLMRWLIEEVAAAEIHSLVSVKALVRINAVLVVPWCPVLLDLWLELSTVCGPAIQIYFGR